jgi:hypothetical protein
MTTRTSLRSIAFLVVLAVPGAATGYTTNAGCSASPEWTEETWNRVVAPLLAR